MQWLLWKDFRLARPVFLLAVALLFLPHLVVCVATGFDPAQYECWAVLYSVLLGQIPLLLLGGLAMAGERGDRSAEFLACQPLRRGHLLASKLVVALSLLALVLIPNLVVLAILGPRIYPWHRLVDRILLPLGFMATLGLCCFTVAWLFSSWLESPTFAACAGLLIPLTLATGLAVLWAYWIDPLSWRHFFPTWAVIWLLLTVGSFVGGTVHYLRRVEP